MQKIKFDNERPRFHASPLLTTFRKPFEVYLASLRKTNNGLLLSVWMETSVAVCHAAVTDYEIMSFIGPQ